MPSFFHSACRFSGASFRVGVGLFGPGKLGHEEVGQLAGDRQIVFAFGGDVEELRGFVQAARVGDLVFAALALRHRFRVRTSMRP